MSTPSLMGILNITPDSFFDGGAFLDPEAASRRAKKMEEQGADIIDIGGQSSLETEQIGVEEELRRVLPVVEKMRNLQCETSIDTYQAEVARRALEAGANMINDISAGRSDPEMFQVIADAGCPYIMMHSKDREPPAQKREVHYDDVLKTIHAFFEERIDAALRSGIHRGQIILDPGLGHFISSDPRYSWEILEGLERLQDLGCRILVSPSRKSFTARGNEPPSERLEETLRATRIAAEHGADMVRTHDVADTRKCLAPSTT